MPLWCNSEDGSMHGLMIILFQEEFIKQWKQSVDTDWSQENLHDAGEEDMLVVNSNVISYENEPLAVPRQEVLNVEQDVDGVSPDTLESRFDWNISVNQW